MATTAVNPRRRPASNASPDNLADAFSTMSLQKGETLHAGNNTDSDLLDPLVAARNGTPSSPLRSTTCPQSLEQLLISAGERRAADLLKRVDEAVATQSKLAFTSALSDSEVLPVPSSLKEEEDDDGTQTEVKTRTRSHSHSSDSGIGSSVESFTGKTGGSVATRARRHADIVKEGNMDERPAPVLVNNVRGMSEHAKDQIHKHIVKPILREESLKEFHSLIKDVPRKIGNKEINTLRELERALIFVAPEYTASPQKYLDFCERTVRVLHTTVTSLHESDQRAPTDRPYTQGYFVDLVEQIRRYATILAATRAKQAKGEKLDEMDYSPDETVTIKGGVSHNGKPAELVRHKDGKFISIATGEVLSAEDLAAASKRPMTDADYDHEEVLRSMARRKKNAKPEIHECSLCDKEFKRPCDLTKHVKTHERPWKCTDEDCKYHVLGWPTEKERDRHVNDKHSSAPSLYHCLFKPCPYTSKRESNCKQHMEKAHGWVYVRSKNNGKSRASDASRIPLGSVPQSPASMMLTPHTPIAPSPSIQSWSTSSRQNSLAPSAGPSNYGTPAYAPLPSDFVDHFNMNFDFNDISDNFAMTAMPMTPALSEDRRTSMSGASSHGLILDGSSYHDAITPEELHFSNDFDFSMNYPQQQTPNSGIHFASNSKAPENYDLTAAYISPHASADLPFISPHPSYDGMDVSDEPSSSQVANGNADFTLFSNAGAQSTSAGAEMFPSLGEGQGWANYGTQFDIAAPAQFKSDNSAINELFPELNNQL